MIITRRNFIRLGGFSPLVFLDRRVSADTSGLIPEDTAERYNLFFHLRQQEVARKLSGYPFQTALPDSPVDILTRSVSFGRFAPWWQAMSVNQDIARLIFRLDNGQDANGSRLTVIQDMFAQLALQGFGLRSNKADERIHSSQQPDGSFSFRLGGQNQQSTEAAALFCLITTDPARRNLSREFLWGTQRLNGWATSGVEARADPSATYWAKLALGLGWDDLQTAVAKLPVGTDEPIHHFYRQLAAASLVPYPMIRLAGGDLNADGQFNLADVSQTINLATNQSEQTSGQTAAAIGYPSRHLGIVDAVRLLRQLLGLN